MQSIKEIPDKNKNISQEAGYHAMETKQNFHNYFPGQKLFSNNERKVQMIFSEMLFWVNHLLALFQPFKRFQRNSSGSRGEGKGAMPPPRPIKNSHSLQKMAAKQDGLYSCLPTLLDPLLLNLILR